MIDEALRRRGQGDRESANLPELARPAGVHPGRRRAAERDQLRSGRARPHGQGQHRHRREDGRARRRLHSEERPSPPATRTPRACSPTIARPTRASRSPAACPTVRVPAGREPPACKNVADIDAKALTDGRREQGAQESQGQGDRTWPLHGHSRAARQRALPLAAHSESSTPDGGFGGGGVVAAAVVVPGAQGAPAGGPRSDGRRRRWPLRRRWRRWWWRRWWLFGANAPGSARRSFMTGKKVGDKLFSDLFTLKSDVGNQMLRQTTILEQQQAGAAGDLGREGHPQGVRRRNQGANVNMTPGAGRHGHVHRRHDQADAPRPARHAVLVHPRRAVAGAAAAQHRHDARRISSSSRTARSWARCRTSAGTCRRSSATTNLSLVGKPVPMEMGEAFGAANAALVPPVRIEEFYMTSVSPAV